MKRDENDRAGLSPIRRPLLECPSCRSTRLDPVVERVVDEVHFLCRTCGRCWDVQLGSVRRIAPQTCRGCTERRWCEQVYAADHPTQRNTTR
jgi:transposase-like protein